MVKALSDIEFNRITGQKTSLKEYKGKVLLVVNVASKCGLTPQYEQLEKIYEQFHGQGFEVLGFPANEFLRQEPGSNEEIQEFCQTKFGVKFPMFEKIVVKGQGQHPLYQQLTEIIPTARKKSGSQMEQRLKDKGLLNGKPNDIMWNFEKFLINRKGEVVARFSPDTTPDDPELLKAIEAELRN